MSASIRPIVCRAGDKLQFLEEVARHPHTHDYDVSVAVGISNRIDKYTGVAIVSQVWLATFIGGTERGVRNAVTRMEALGLLHIERPAPAPGGRGKANIYRPKTLNSRSGGNAEQPLRVSADSTENAASANAEQCNDNPGTGIPTLPNTYLDSSGGAGRESVSCEQDLWQSIKSSLTKRLSADIVHAWFSRVKIEEIEDDEIIFVAPTKFQAGYLQNKYWRHLLMACQDYRPGIKTICIRPPKSVQATE